MWLYEKKLRKGLILSVIMLLLSMCSYVFALLFQISEPVFVQDEPRILGSFTMVLEVNEVKDLYAWQVVVLFNSEELGVLQVLPGEFLGTGFPFFVYASDVNDGMLLLGETLVGDVQGKSGSGRLATIVFGFYVETFKLPRIALSCGCFDSFLLDSSLSSIPIEDGMLTLRVI